MESVKYISYAENLRIYRESFKNHFGYNIDGFMSATQGFDMGAFCDIINYTGTPKGLESFIKSKFGIRALIILRKVNNFPARRVLRKR